MGVVEHGDVDRLRRLAGDGSSDLKSRRLEIGLGYGFSAFGGRFTSTPEIAIGLSDTGRDYRLGWRLAADARAGGSLELSLEATRRESANDNADPEHGIGLRLTFAVLGVRAGAAGTRAADDPAHRIGACRGPRTGGSPGPWAGP